MVIQLRQILHKLLVMVLFFSATVLFTGSAMALDRDPQSPNCFVNSAQGYQKNPCPDNSKIQAGKCYSLQQRGDAYLVHELNCVNGATMGAAFTVEGTDAPIQPTTIGNATTGSSELDGWLRATINLLSATVGIVIVLSLVFAGIQYMTAGGNASQVAAAKNRIVMAILALVLFLFTYAILQWLIPGGIF